jgi:hypothetical protein
VVSGVADWRREAVRREGGCGGANVVEADGAGDVMSREKKSDEEEEEQDDVGSV